jgi:hypothetical protein
MSIGTWRCAAVNVTDFEIGYRFWSAITGFEILGPEHGYHGWLGYLGTTDPPKHELILIHADQAPIRAPAPTHHETNPVHIDITPNDGIDTAIPRILELGGSIKKPPCIYPRPGSYPDSRPVIDWAVMQDPFGNEFCLVYDLTETQSQAAIDAAERGATTDHEFRLAAGQTTPATRPEW